MLQLKFYSHWPTFLWLLPVLNWALYFMVRPIIVINFSSLNSKEFREDLETILTHEPRIQIIPLRH